MAENYSEEGNSTKSDGILISLIYYPVITLGPGKRLGIWTQGCSRHCAGCISKHTWEFDERKRVSWSRIESVLSENILKTSSLTISGGEPFDQIEELHRLLKLARQIGYTDILLYTGYTIEELKEKYENKFEEITNLISVLIDGRFVQGLDTDLIWKGSENQRMFIYENNQDIRKTYEEYMTRTKDNKLQLVTFEGVIYIVGILRQK